MRLLAGKKAIVTGGASGIGRAIAKEFLLEGASLVIVLDKDGFKTKEFGFALGENQKLLTCKVDISQKEEVKKVLRPEVLKDLDILINNAGVDIGYSVKTPDESIWNHVLGTNLEGTKQVTELVVKEMIAYGRGGCLVFITSVHSQRVFHRSGAYDVSKHAVLGYMRHCALELAKYGIRSNAIAPGAIYPTGITGHMSKEQVRRQGEKIPIGRVGSPDEVARACVFLVSNLASYITGAELPVDGGFSLVGPFS